MAGGVPGKIILRNLFGLMDFPRHNAHPTGNMIKSADNHNSQEIIDENPVANPHGGYTRQSPDPNLRSYHHFIPSTINTMQAAPASMSEKRSQDPLVATRRIRKTRVRAMSKSIVTNLRRSRNMMRIKPLITPNAKQKVVMLCPTNSGFMATGSNLTGLQGVQKLQITLHAKAWWIYRKHKV